MYIFSILTSVIACAKPRQEEEYLLVGKNGISEWLVSFRGVRSIIDSASHLMLSGPVAPIFSAGIRKTRLREAVGVKEYPFLQDIYRLIAESDETPEALHAYKSAVSEMSKSFGAVFKSVDQDFEFSDVFFWLFMVSDEFLTLLANKRPIAFIIFAHFCVLLKRLEWTWWMEGWSVHLLSIIYHSIGHEYQPWIQWPMEQIGWVPEEL